MKKVLILLAIFLIFSISSVYAYTDLVGEDEFYKTPAEVLTELGITDGYIDGTYKPDNNTPRAQFAKMLVLCLGLGDEVDTVELNDLYEDVPANHWAAPYIQICKNLGLMKDYEAGTTFAPEQNITIAEVFYGAIRALGYGDMVDNEDVYPRNYMLKAVELEITDGLNHAVVANNPATRGDIAIVLWNMLRTPMYRVYDEQQSGGMSIHGIDDTIMLNLKFPNYRYISSGYVYNMEFLESDISLTIGYDTTSYTASAIEMDLVKLISGMNVDALIKNYRDEDKAKYIYVGNLNTVVMGIIDDYDDSENTIEVDGTIYSFASEDVDNPVVSPGEYALFEVRGTKVCIYNYEYVLRTLPIDGTYVESLSAINRVIGEDDFVIIDGVLTTRDDIEVGDVYTEVDIDNGSLWVVSRGAIDSIFDGYAEMENGVDVITLDGEDYRLSSSFRAFHNEDLIDIDDLKAKAKDNQYLGNDVTVYNNYLNMPVRAEFGEYHVFYDVGDINKDGIITVADIRLLIQAYVSPSELTEEQMELMDMDGDGIITIGDIRRLIQEYINPFPEGTFIGKVESIRVRSGIPYVKIDGEWIELDIENGDSVVSASEELLDELSELNGMMVLYKYSKKDKIVIFDTLSYEQLADGNASIITAVDREIIQFRGGVLSGDIDLENLDDYEDYDIYQIEAGVDKDDFVKFYGGDNFGVGLDKGHFSLGDRVVVVDDNKTIFIVTIYGVSEADSIDEDGFVTYDEDDSYEESSIMEYALVQAASTGSRGTFVKIDGERILVDLENPSSIVDSYDDVESLIGEIIAYRSVVDCGTDKVVINGSLTISQLANGNASIVTAREGNIISLSGGVLNGELDVKNCEYKDYDIVLVYAFLNKNYVEFEECDGDAGVLNAGLFTVDSRVVVDDTIETMYMVYIDGVTARDTVNANGSVTFFDNGEG